MRVLNILLLFMAISLSTIARDRLRLFINSANQYASVELSDYRKRLCAEYNTRGELLDDYYGRCGRDWGNVCLALEIARASGKPMRDVCDYYRHYHRQGWERILAESGIRPGSIHYDRFRDRIDCLRDRWGECYRSCRYHRDGDYRHGRRYREYGCPRHHRCYDND